VPDETDFDSFAGALTAFFRAARRKRGEAGEAGSRPLSLSQFTVLQTVEDEKCDSLVVIPVMLQRIMRLDQEILDKHDLSTIKCVAASGSAGGEGGPCLVHDATATRARRHRLIARLCATRLTQARGSS